MKITEITRQDFQAFWPVFKNVIEAQETYAFAPDMSVDDAYQLWCVMPDKSFIAKENGVILERVDLCCSFLQLTVWHLD